MKRNERTFLKGTKLAKDDRDEVTEATAPGDTLNGVMLTMSAPKPLPKPAKRQKRSGHSFN